MKQKHLSKLETIPFITKEMLLTLSGDSNQTINKTIQRWCKNGTLIRLKGGLYTLGKTYNQNISKEGYLEQIANKLRTPSYISTEYALSKYSILTESIYPITSVTVKNSRIYQNKTGGYIYRNIKDELFCGYTIQKYSDKEIYIATKEKALFDYLYYKSPTLPTKLKNINLVEELRLNIYDFKKKELNMLRKYAQISKSKKISKIVENIIQNVHTYN